jgi:hypothetical protein
MHAAAAHKNTVKIVYGNHFTFTKLKQSKFDWSKQMVLELEKEAREPLKNYSASAEVWRRG